MLKKFRYTVSNKGLSYKQRQFYEENGYVIIKNNFSHTLLDEFSEYFHEVCNGRIGTSSRIIKDPLLKKLGVKAEEAIFKLQDFHDDDFLFRYATYSPLVDIVESIIGPNIMAVNSMLINKPQDLYPDQSRYPVHQDLHYFPFRPVNSIVASWTAMEPIRKENGCLFIYPGTHSREQLYEHDYPMGSRTPLFHGVTDVPTEETKIDVMLDKGDTVFFHPLLLHASGPNLSEVSLLQSYIMVISH
ncbi:hypothetical protein HHI36_017283 [Cryptolaemus montrouzieri]|uniref:phytanoyl-CoA dioxygenase n=1 Tax=Cryptolaemus montrouzieri TaxID=559131 RepID=A0ABD2NMD3_9CUCU